MSDRWAVLRLASHDLVLSLLPGIGGRLWDVTFQGRSLLFQNPDLVDLTFDDANLTGLPTRAPHFGFPLWGGEKTWIAPDRAWPDNAPFPALDAGAYQVTSSGPDHVEMTSALCPLSQLVVSRRISLTAPDAWTIDHAVTNHGSSARLSGIWSVMMIDTPAKIGVALDVPAYNPVFGDPKTMVAKYPGCCIADCASQQEFKVGIPNPTGRTLIRFGKNGPLLLCSVAAPDYTQSYAHQHPVEVFNSGDYAYCEAEWHSPQTTLLPDDTLTFRQDFRIWAHEDPSVTPDGLTTNEKVLMCMS